MYITSLSSSAELFYDKVRYYVGKNENGEDVLFIELVNDEKKLFVFVLPADFSISLKKARTLTKSGQIDLLKTSDLQKYTGYIRGGCSPLGMIKKYPTFIEETVLLEDFICVSARSEGK